MEKDGGMGGGLEGERGHKKISSSRKRKVKESGNRAHARVRRFTRPVWTRRSDEYFSGRRVVEVREFEVKLSVNVCVCVVRKESDVDVDVRGACELARGSV